MHYDLVVITRRIDEDGEEPIRRHHWAQTGSDPHLSYGTLRAAAKRVMRRLR